MAVVELKNVSKDFGGHPILRDVSLRIEESEFMVFVGPSGCGKSTILRIIAGFEAPSEGEILIDGVSVSGLPPDKRDLAMVFQNYALYPSMTVEENLGFGLKNLRVPNSEIRERVRATAAALQIENLLKRRPDQLSGGQRQRVAIGRAIIKNPKLYLFDEPLSNVDALLRSQLRVELSTLHQRLRTTTIYVTHDQVEAMTLANRIAIVNAGKIEQIGTPLELYNSPRNTFVAGFLGSPSMNILTAGIAVCAGGRPEVVIGDFRLPVPVSYENLTDGEKISVGVRPEDFEIVPDDRRGMRVHITVIERLGSRNIIFCRPDAESLRDTSIAVEASALETDGTLKPGDTLTLQIKGKLHVFGTNGISLEQSEG